MTVETTTLANGLRIVTDHMPHVETVSLGVWVAVGARNERAENNGVSHFLEHMAFKGTKTRSARAIAEEIEAVGGQLNAHTSREMTAFHATVLKADVGVAVDIIADILQNSMFDETEIARERVVIAQEIGEARDVPDDVVFDSFQMTAFPGQAMGWPILGPEENVAGMRRTTLVDYMAAHYGAPRMVVSAAGNLGHAGFVTAVERAFAGLGPVAANGVETARYCGGETRAARDLEQVHLVVGFEGLPYADPDFFALSVMSMALGGGMSSRLFQEIRESRGLVYSVYSFAAPYTDTGLFAVYAGTGEEQLADLVPLLCGEMAKAADGMTEPELARARAQLKAGMLMSLESSSARCEQIARQLQVFGRVLDISEIVGKIDAVDAAAVTRVARRIFSGKPSLSALGPVASLESYDSIAKRFG